MMTIDTVVRPSSWLDRWIDRPNRFTDYTECLRKPASYEPINKQQINKYRFMIYVVRAVV